MKNGKELGRLRVAFCEGDPRIRGEEYLGRKDGLQ